MATFKILQYPDPRLSRKGYHVTHIDDHIDRIINDMFETHYQAKNCGALAATQLDMPNPPHITVIDFSEKKNQPLCLINAEIIEREGELYEGEGCMSVAGVYDKVKRARKIKVRAMNRKGETTEFVVEGGYMVRCIQHELDHLNGTIFLDRLSKLKRERIDRKFKKWLRK